MHEKGTFSKVPEPYEPVLYKPVQVGGVTDICQPNDKS